ncbi:MAG: macrolide ABC transporter ATP-binding protein [Elusimicrobia bacterium RIFOXYA2_FULL_39_19]|nr:MAG: macrolide ABC transporter ATP-binding protein [Elusimicrobia bacterium RIFOXYA2_FULL_39_19]
MKNTVIELKNITKTYITGAVEFKALDNIDLTVKEGDFLAIMGPSGSGKSTCMNIIGCLDRPTSGSYTLENKEVANLNDNELAYIRNKRIGFVFQTFNLLARTDAVKNIELPLIYSGAKNRKERAIECLNMVGLADKGKNRPNELSGGQQQRVAIARAIVNNPSIILADEPTGNLDSKSGDEIMKIFVDLNKQGKTIILITHEPDIAGYAQRKIQFKDGIILPEIIK